MPASGWYLAEVVDHLSNLSTGARSLWINYVLYQADDPETAYQKALAQNDREGSILTNRLDEESLHEFVGFRNLSAVVEPLADGSTLIHEIHENPDDDWLATLIPPKNELVVLQLQWFWSADGSAVAYTGWYLAELVQQFYQPATKTRSIWINFVLIRADHPETAYEKALKVGEKYTYIQPDTLVESSFLGLCGLFDIYNDLEDGEEVLYAEYEDIDDETLAKNLKSKHEWSAFKAD